METLGFIGIGLMGYEMVTRLLAAGYNVVVWNRTSQKTDVLGRAGAVASQSIAELVQSVDVVMLCLSDTAAVEDVVFSSEGVASYAREGQLLLDLSSIEPEATRKFAKELYSKSAADWVDCPVSGGVVGARDGTLAIMAGGDATCVDRARPVLQELGQRVTHMGAVGSGQVTKVCNQMIVACNAMVIAEMTALAQQSGVAVDKIPEALSGGFADSKPLRILVPQMARRTFEPIAWHVKTLLKDLDTAVKLSHQCKSAVPMSAAAAQLMRLHGAQGYLDSDLSTLIELYQHEET